MSAGSQRSWGWSTSRPDSFSDGGRYLDAGAAIAHGLELEAEGAAILDVGGESTRPGAAPVAADEELRRVVPVIEGLIARRRARPDLDRHLQGGVAARRARRRRDAGQRRDRAARRSRDGGAWWPTRGADCCLMHMLGEPRTMQNDPRYDDVVAEVKAFLEERMAFAVRAGDRRGADPARPRDRVRQDGRAQPRAAAPPRRAGRARAPGRDRHLAQVVPGQAHRPRRADDRRGRDDRHQRARVRARGARVPGPRRGPGP